MTTLKKQATRKPTDQMAPGEIMVRGALNQEEYFEKPRPSLFNVIKKLHESNGQSFNRLCYVAKLVDNFKGDIEKDFSNWTMNICSNDDEKEFNPKGDEPPRYSGFAIILGSWMVHLFEAENPLMGRYVRKLSQRMQAKDSYTQSVWVIHFTEDVPQQAYNNWFCKQVNTQQAAREIKNLPELERVNHIYSSMVSIGMQAQQVQNKGQAQVIQTMK
mmetsp:Transcript_5012/g.8548  ORF Transcript_5012/g.8548 Transcript_5012/m.8548 type:complete len:216 (-) Transcript_5012:185-832(-)